MSRQSEPSDAPRLTGADPNARRALLRLLAVVAAGVLVSIFTDSLPVLIVIFALIAMVMVHEFGHFVVAKVSGMKVTEYFLGFGPRLWSIRRGETEYGVKAIPAGGYVRIVGMTTAEEIDPSDEDRSYRQSTFPRRLAVGLAGSATHFVMAFVLLFAMFVFSGVQTYTNAEVSALRSFANATAPAKSAGLRAGDVIVSLDGRSYVDATQYVDAIEDHADRPVTLVVERDHRRVTLRLTPLDGRDVRLSATGPTLDPKSGPAVGVIGVELNFAVKNVTTGPIVAVQRAGSMLGSLTAATGESIAQVFSLHGLSSFVHEVATARNGSSSSSSASGNSGQQIVSIVGAVQIGAQAARQNISELLLILVAINLFVGMVNLFPMLPLDGGHVAIAIYERIRTRRGAPAYHADVAKLMPIAYLFLAGIALFGLGALYVNVVHPASLPGG